MSEEPQIRVWVEQETVHLKVSETHGDPVELTEIEAKKLAVDLIEAVRKIEALNLN